MATLVLNEGDRQTRFGDSYEQLFLGIFLTSLILGCISRLKAY
jgi:hypothetical protein